MISRSGFTEASKRVELVLSCSRPFPKKDKRKRLKRTARYKILMTRVYQKLQARDEARPEKIICRTDRLQ